MNSAILVVGLGLAFAGTFLAWHRKGSGTWATFSFGFLLVLVGGPASDRLESLSVSGEGVEVAFNAASVSAAEAGEIAEQAKAAFLALTAQSEEGASPGDAVLGVASESFQKDLVEFIVGAGFIPAQPIGVELMRPGTVLRIENGKPTVLATSNEAFPTLEVTESSVAIPEFAQDDRTDSSAVSVAFRCRQGSKVLQTSLYSMTSSQSAKVFSSFGEPGDIRIIQSVITCLGFELSTSYKSNEGVKDYNVRYGEDSDLIIGVKYSKINID